MSIVILALILGAVGAFYFKSYLPNTVAPKSFPQIDGEIQLEGLNGPVDIYRDKMGIPHIYATTSHDLFFAQGYVHAQDRFWQMDTWRHIGSGTLSEMFGKGQVETDTFLPHAWLAPRPPNRNMQGSTSNQNPLSIPIPMA